MHATLLCLHDARIAVKNDAQAALSKIPPLTWRRLADSIADTAGSS